MPTHFDREQERELDLDLEMELYEFIDDLQEHREVIDFGEVDCGKQEEHDQNFELDSTFISH